MYLCRAHTYTAKNKNPIQHDPARYSRIEHARSRNTDHCLKTKHFLAHAPLTLRCLCQCNLQYIRPGAHTTKSISVRPALVSYSSSGHGSSSEALHGDECKVEMKGAREQVQWRNTRHKSRFTSYIVFCYQRTVSDKTLS